MNRYAIVLAAGKGSRMKSLRDDISKVSYPILKVPLVDYVLRSLKPLGLSRVITVLGFGGETSEKIVEGKAEVVWQREQKGTGHAIMQASPLLGGLEGSTIICCGDTPLLTTQTLDDLLKKHEDSHNDLTILTGILDDPRGYGRIIENGGGRVVAIREQKDCSEEENGIRKINAGVYVFDNRLLFECLPLLKPGNKAKEYYLTDLVGIFNEKGYRVGAMVCEDFDETLGVNDRVQLAAAAKIIRGRINRALMLSGVSIEDPENTYIGPDVEIGPDTVIAPGTHIYGHTKIGCGNHIGPSTYLENTAIGNDNVIEFCHITDSEVFNHTTLGPYFRARKGVKVRDGAHIGNFNEMKNVDFGEGSKCAHLSYLGDSDIGKNVNVGCGTIVANYDGVNKFHSKVDDNAFIGSGTILISPVHMGKGSLSAAGSTITKDIEEDSMGIARGRQENKPGYAITYHRKALDKKGR